MNAEIRKLKDCLEIIVSGEYSFSFLFSLIDRIDEESKINNSSLILLDMTRIIGTPENMERFQLGVKAATVLKRPYKILVLAEASKINKFGENVAVNRGADLLVTPDREPGVQWLTRKRQKAPVLST